MRVKGEGVLTALVARGGDENPQGVREGPPSPTGRAGWPKADRAKPAAGPSPAVSAGGRFATSAERFQDEVRTRGESP